MNQQTHAKRAPAPLSIPNNPHFGARKEEMILGLLALRAAGDRSVGSCWLTPPSVDTPSPPPLSVAWQVERQYALPYAVLRNAVCRERRRPKNQAFDAASSPRGGRGQMGGWRGCEEG